MPEVVTVLSHWDRCSEGQADENLMRPNTLERTAQGELLIDSPVRESTEGWARGSVVSETGTRLRAPFALKRTPKPNGAITEKGLQLPKKSSRKIIPCPLRGPSSAPSGKHP